MGARVLGVLLGDHDRVAFIRQREQPADRRLDAAKVPAALEGRPVDRAAAAIVRQEDAAALVDLGAYDAARRVVGVDLFFRIEPPGIPDLGPQERPDLAAACLDRRAFPEIDVAAVLAAGVELLGVGRDHRAAMRHAVGDEPAGEDVCRDRAKPRMVKGDGGLVHGRVGLSNRREFSEQTGQVDPARRFMAGPARLGRGAGRGLGGLGGLDGVEHRRQGGLIEDAVGVGGGVGEVAVARLHDRQGAPPQPDRHAMRTAHQGPRLVDLAPPGRIEGCT